MVTSSDAMSPIRVAVVDDHPAIASAIAGALRDSPQEGRRIEIVATAKSVLDGLRLFEPGRDKPDVVLCDIQLESGADGLRVLDAAVDAGCRVIVLTGFDRAAFSRAAFERGAVGFLSKGIDVAEIVGAVRAVAAGGTAFSAATLDSLRAAPRPPSDRELAILGAVSRGLTSGEIGLELEISDRTVESHLRRLFDRYGVASRAELAVLAEREGWLTAAGE